MTLPLTVWLGIFTFISLFTTATFGRLTRMGKPVFKYHRFFAYLTLILAVIHVVSVIVKFWG